MHTTPAMEKTRLRRWRRRRGSGARIHASTDQGESGNGGERRDGKKHDVERTSRNARLSNDKKLGISGAGACPKWIMKEDRWTTRTRFGAEMGGMARFTPNSTWTARR